MGRTGTLWAYEQTGVVPDAITVAKALGGGLPIGALVTGPRLADVFEPGDHGSTFAGGPVVAAAALAALDVIDDRELLARVRELGAPRSPPAWSACPTCAGARARPDARLRARRPGARRSCAARCSSSGSSSTPPGPTTVRLLPPLTIGEAARSTRRSRASGALALPVRWRYRLRRRPVPVGPTAETRAAAPTASYEADPGEVHRVLLLYSGGLDTSVMLKWIQDDYDAEVVCADRQPRPARRGLRGRRGQGAAARRARLPRRRRARGVRPRLRRAGDQGQRALRRRLPAVHRARAAR